MNLYSGNMILRTTEFDTYRKIKPCTHHKSYNRIVGNSLHIKTEIIDLNTNKNKNKIKILLRIFLCGF